MRFLAVSILTLALTVEASAQASSAAQKKASAAAAKSKALHPIASAKTRPAKPLVSKSTASKGTATKAGSKTASKTGAKSRRTVVARRPPTQQQPTPDRYKEIQQALVDKGYFHGPADGAWSTGSVEALKRFQKDQNLDPDGKIGSLSLIALGLGPKRGAGPAQSARPASEAVDPPTLAEPRR